MSHLLAILDSAKMCSFFTFTSVKSKSSLEQLHCIFIWVLVFFHFSFSHKIVSLDVQLTTSLYWLCGDSFALLRKTIKDFFCSKAACRIFLQFFGWKHTCHLRAYISEYTLLIVCFIPLALKSAQKVRISNKQTDWWCG